MEITSEMAEAVFDAMFVPCGLNADWCVSAWYLGIGEPNKTDGSLYLLENEDGSFSVVARHYAAEHGEPSSDFFFILWDFEYASDVFIWLGLHSRTLIPALALGILQDRESQYASDLRKWKEGK